MIFAPAFGVVEEPTRKFHQASGPKNPSNLKMCFPLKALIFSLDSAAREPELLQTFRRGRRMILLARL